MGFIPKVVTVTSGVSDSISTSSGKSAVRHMEENFVLITVAISFFCKDTIGRWAGKRHEKMFKFGVTLFNLR